MTLRTLLAAVRERFLKEGGILLEHAAFRSAEVYNDGVLMRCVLVTQICGRHTSFGT